MMKSEFSKNVARFGAAFALAAGLSACATPVPPEKAYCVQMGNSTSYSIVSPGLRSDDPSQKLVLYTIKDAKYDSLTNLLSGKIEPTDIVPSTDRADTLTVDLSEMTCTVRYKKTEYQQNTGSSAETRTYVLKHGHGFDMF